MNLFNATEVFSQWLVKLRDIKGRVRILSRIDSAAEGNFGDCESVGEGVSEMRVHYGPGYRIYFAQEDACIYLLLAGGDKKSQSRDIARAKKLWERFKKGGL